MILKIFAVRDIKADAFDRPFFSQSKGVAIRSFSDAVNDPKHPMSPHPEDYELYELGEYDDQSGLFKTVTPKQVGVASDFVSKK